MPIMYWINFVLIWKIIAKSTNNTSDQTYSYLIVYNMDRRTVDGYDEI